jgi:hypothetical protein
MALQAVIPWGLDGQQGYSLRAIPKLSVSALPFKAAWPPQALDTGPILKTMMETGLDMKAHYRETSQGGLAIHWTGYRQKNQKP